MNHSNPVHHYTRGRKYRNIEFYTYEQILMYWKYFHGFFFHQQKDFRRELKKILKKSIRKYLKIKNN